MVIALACKVPPTITESVPNFDIDLLVYFDRKVNEHKGKNDFMRHTLHAGNLYSKHTIRISHRCSFWSYLQDRHRPCRIAKLWTNQVMQSGILVRVNHQSSFVASRRTHDCFNHFPAIPGSNGSEKRCLSEFISHHRAMNSVIHIHHGVSFSFKKSHGSCSRFIELLHFYSIVKSSTIGIANLPVSLI